VTPDSGAAEAGLKTGTLLTHIDDKVRYYKTAHLTNYHIAAQELIPSSCTFTAMFHSR
jgi:hypothetical protein